MRELYNLLRESRNYLLFALVLFTVSAGLGYSYSELFEAQISAMLNELGDIVEHVKEKDSALYTAWFIFQNNTKAALMMVFVGVILFFVPFFTLFANGLVIGYVLKHSALEGIPAFDLFLYALMPHGILELPAILIAGGMGMFLGVRLIQWIFGQGQFLSHLVGKQERSDVRTFWNKHGKPVFLKRIQAVSTLLIIIIVMLFIAAAIESFITPSLIAHFITL
jgi:stage II sporulation protein M